MKSLGYGAAISTDATEAWGAQAITQPGAPLDYVWNRRDQWSDVTNTTEMSVVFKQHFDICTAWFEAQWGKKARDATKTITTEGSVFSCVYRAAGGYVYVSISRIPTVVKPKRGRRATPT